MCLRDHTSVDRRKTTPPPKKMSGECAGFSAYFDALGSFGDPDAFTSVCDELSKAKQYNMYCLFPSTDDAQLTRCTNLATDSKDDDDLVFKNLVDTPTVNAATQPHAYLREFCTIVPNFTSAPSSGEVPRQSTVATAVPGSGANGLLATNTLLYHTDTSANTPVWTATPNIVVTSDSVFGPVRGSGTIDDFCFYFENASTGIEPIRGLDMTTGTTTDLGVTVDRSTYTLRRVAGATQQPSGVLGPVTIYMIKSAVASTEFDVVLFDPPSTTTSVRTIADVAQNIMSVSGGGETVVLASGDYGTLHIYHTIADTVQDIVLDVVDASLSTSGLALYIVSSDQTLYKCVRTSTTVDFGQPVAVQSFGSDLTGVSTDTTGRAVVVDGVADLFYTTHDNGLSWVVIDRTRTYGNTTPVTSLTSPLISSNGRVYASAAATTGGTTYTVTYLRPLVTTTNVSGSGTVSVLLDNGSVVKVNTTTGAILWQAPGPDPASSASVLQYATSRSIVSPTVVGPVLSPNGRYLALPCAYDNLSYEVYATPWNTPDNLMWSKLVDRESDSLEEFIVGYGAAVGSLDYRVGCQSTSTTNANMLTDAALANAAILNHVAPSTPCLSSSCHDLAFGDDPPTVASSTLSSTTCVTGRSICTDLLRSGSASLAPPWEGVNCVGENTINVVSCSECPAGFSCAPDEAAVCYRSCTSTSECGSGHQCSSDGLCMPVDVPPNPNPPTTETDSEFPGGAWVALWVVLGVIVVVVVGVVSAYFARRDAGTGDSSGGSDTGE